jgi:hypothetical protein
VNAARPPMGPGHVGSIPLLATRLEQATAAEAIMRRAGYPESMLYGRARAQRVADSRTRPLNLATPARTAHWPAADERGRADATVSGPPCPSAPGQARVAVDEDEHGGPDRETDHNDHP